MKLSKSVLVLAGVFFACSVLAQSTSSASQNGAKKVMLKIASVETAATRHQKTWDPPSRPMALQERPYSDAQIMNATPEEAERMRAKNENVMDAQQKANALIAWQNWSAADAHMRGVQAQLEGNAYGRQIILALDKFVGEAGTYFDPDCIEFFHRMDNDEGIKEQFIQDMQDPGTLSAPYFLKLVFDDPREEKGTTQINGLEIKMTKAMQLVTYEVQDLQGKIITAGNVRGEVTTKTTSAVQQGGTSGNQSIAALEDALTQVAKKINDFFVAKVSFVLVGPKNDEEFDEYAGTILVDGEGHASGDEFSILKGSHTVVVEMEGYRRAGSPSLVVNASQSYRLPMVSSGCELTIVVKGPAGDAEFDGDAATISLTGENEYFLMNGTPEKIPQGEYTLSVSVDGYGEYTKALKLTLPKQTIPVLLKK